MRYKVLLLGVGVGLIALLTVDIAMRLAQAPLPAAHGEGAGEVLIAASQTQNEAFCFVYDTGTRQLVSYMSRNGDAGIELKGIRTCASDFNPKIVEYPKSKRPTRVTAMQKIAEELAQEEKK